MVIASWTAFSGCDPARKRVHRLCSLRDVSSTVDRRCGLGKRRVLDVRAGKPVAVRNGSGASTGSDGTRRSVRTIGSRISTGSSTGLADTVGSSVRDATSTGTSTGTNTGSTGSSTSANTSTSTGVVRRRAKVLGLGRGGVAWVLLAGLHNGKGRRIPVLVGVSGSSLGSRLALVNLLDPAIGVTEVGEDRVTLRGGKLKGTVAGLLLVVGVLGEGLLEGVSDTLALQSLVALDAVTELNELAVEVLETITDTLLGSLGDLLFNDTGGEGLDHLDERVVLAVADGKLELVNLGNDLLDGEDVAALLASRSVLSLEVNGDSETLTTKEDVGGTALLELGEAKLLVEEEVDVAHVGLDLVQGELERVLVAVTELVKLRELEVVANVHLGL